MWTRKPRPDEGRPKWVYIASPYRGNRKRNLRLAAKYTRMAIQQGLVPITPHLFYASVLDDNIEQERAQGMLAGQAMLLRCDEVWVFGSPTEGMRAEIDVATQHGIVICHYTVAGDLQRNGRL